MYSNAEEDDKRAAKEAGLKALEEIQKEQQATESGDGNNDKTKRIDVDELLRAPPSTNLNGTRTNGVNGHIVGMPRPPLLPQPQQQLHDQHLQNLQNLANDYNGAIMRRFNQDFLNRLGRR